MASRAIHPGAPRVPSGAVRRAGLTPHGRRARSPVPGSEPGGPERARQGGRGEVTRDGERRGPAPHPAHLRPPPRSQPRSPPASLQQQHGCRLPPPGSSARGGGERDAPPRGRAGARSQQKTPRRLLPTRSAPGLASRALRRAHGVGCPPGREPRAAAAGAPGSSGFVCLRRGPGEASPGPPGAPAVQPSDLQEDRGAEGGVREPGGACTEGLPSF